MIKTSEEYKRIMRRPIRNRGYAKVEMYLVNNDAQSALSVTSTGANFSKGSIIGYANNLTTYGVLEDNYIPCDGSFRFLNTYIASSQLKNNGYTSADFYGSLVLKVDGIFDVTGMTIDFGESYPTNFTIKLNTTTYTFTNNERVFTTDKIKTISGNITITPTKFITTGDSKRLHVKSFLIGIKKSFENDTIENISIEQFVSPIAAETSYTNATIDLFDVNDDYAIENESFDNFATYQPIDISFGLELDDGTIEWHKRNRVWLKEWQSKSSKLTLSCTDRMSQQEGIYELGYTNERRMLGDEFVKLFTDCGFNEGDYEIDETLFTYYLVNPVPKIAQKDALQILCNAHCCISYENEYGVIVVKPHIEKSINLSDTVFFNTPITKWGDTQNVWRNGTTCYADFSQNMIRADGNTIFISKDSTYKAGFVSDELANENGKFATEPYLDTHFKRSITNCDGITITFGNAIPKKIRITTGTYNGATIERFEVDNITSNVFEYKHDFENFAQITIRCLETEPNARFVINDIKLGGFNNYCITKDSLLDYPIGNKEQTVKKIVIPNYISTLNGDTYEQVEDKNEEIAVNPTGVTILCENPIVFYWVNARNMCAWLKSYYQYGVSYDVDFRGEPMLQVNDDVYIETKNNTVFTEIEKINFTFDGAWKSSLSVRRFGEIEPIEVMAYQ